MYKQINVEKSFKRLACDKCHASIEIHVDPYFNRETRDEFYTCSGNWLQKVKKCPICNTELHPICASFKSNKNTPIQINKYCYHCDVGYHLSIISIFPDNSEECVNFQEKVGKVFNCCPVCGSTAADLLEDDGIGEPSIDSIFEAEMERLMEKSLEKEYKMELKELAPLNGDWGTVTVLGKEIKEKIYPNVYRWAITHRKSLEKSLKNMCRVDKKPVNPGYVGSLMAILESDLGD